MEKVRLLEDKVEGLTVDVTVLREAGGKAMEATVLVRSKDPNCGDGCVVLKGTQSHAVVLALAGFFSDLEWHPSAPEYHMPGLCIGAVMLG